MSPTPPLRHLRGFVTTPFTASLRIPASRNNRELLRELRETELKLWEESGGASAPEHAARVLSAADKTHPSRASG